MSVWSEVGHCLCGVWPAGLWEGCECQEHAKLSSRQRVATLNDLKSQIDLDLFNTFFGYYMIPHVLFHSFDFYTIILQCRK